MEYEEVMTEDEFDNEMEEDSLPEGIVEEDESYDEDFPDTEDLELPDEEDEEEEEEVEEEKPRKEPGYIKGRIQKAVDKAIAETRAEMQAMFDAQMKPIREKLMEDEAQELVRSRKVADIETARELVRLRNGQPTTANPDAGTQGRGEQPRNDKGQFASREQIVQEARTQARIDELASQAKKIKAAGGPDVIQEFSTNQEIKRKVVNGEMDMYDVAESMRNRKRGKAPSPTRTPNGASNVTPNAFATMSKKQFERFERHLDEGGRFSVK